MAYTDYEFYKSKFYGDTVPESDFLKYAERASDRIDQYTFDRLVDGLPENERVKTKVQKAVCAVADTMYQIDQIKKASMDAIGTIQREDGTVVNKAVSSVSSGNESISYDTGSNISGNVYAQASMDKKVENALLLNVATEYLAGATNDKGICLLYAGL
nr:MAG TPA: Head Tail Connector Protein [Caudoviricetes sp.]